MIDYAATRKLVERMKASGMISAETKALIDDAHLLPRQPPPVTFPALTEAELFWGIAKRVVRSRRAPARH